MCHKVWRLLRAPQPLGIVTHICPSAGPSPPGAAQPDPELPELSPMRSGLAMRGVKSHRTFSESLPSNVLWPCHFLGSLSLARSVRRPKENKVRKPIPRSAAREARSNEGATCEYIRSIGQVSFANGYSTSAQVQCRRDPIASCVSAVCLQIRVVRFMVGRIPLNQSASCWPWPESLERETSNT